MPKAAPIPTARIDFSPAFPHICHQFEADAQSYRGPPPLHDEENP